jgi:hypothetical protein
MTIYRADPTPQEFVGYNCDGRMRGTRPSGGLKISGKERSVGWHRCLTLQRTGG